jgi:FkbH-like protein
MDEYVRSLGIEVTVGMNERVLLPRLSQLSLKTNQFNLTTRRYTEDELAACMDAGGYVFSGTVTDRFGSYGMVVEAVIRHSSPDVAELESYLMSCRTMGRMVEFAFLDHVLGMLVGRGVRTLHASFIPTKKNAPAAEFLRDMGFVQVPSASQTGFCDAYVLDVATYMAGERAQLVRESGILLV